MTSSETLNSPNQRTAHFTAHDNKVYSGKAEVRRYWADVSGPFRPE
jgi:hypothetical protein